MATARNTRPTQARKVQDKPRITGLNLDKLEREGGPKEPYRTVLNGQIFTFKDPAEEDWQDQVKIDETNVVAMLKALLSEDDWQDFKAIRMKAWKLLALGRDIQRYYQVDAESEGNGAASLD